MIKLFDLLNSRPETYNAYICAFGQDSNVADSLVSRYQDMWDSGLSFLADGMDAFTFPKRSADSAEELNACLDALASDLSWLAVKSKIKAMAAADVDSLCEMLAALGGAQIKICGRDLIATDIKSIYNS